jgi:hypothetical protein
MELVLTGPEATAIPLRPRYNDLDGWKKELRDNYQILAGFPGMEFDEVFMHIAAMSARFSEIRMYLVEIGDRPHSHFRTQFVDKFLEELQFLFKVWSRTFSVRHAEQELSGRAT